MIQPKDFNIMRALRPQHAPAAPFILSNTGDKIANSTDAKLCETDAYRYYQGPTGPFITHLKWTLDSKQYELSRMEVVDIWIEAANMFDRLQVTRSVIRKTQEMGPRAEPADPRWRWMYLALTEFQHNIELLHYSMSTFCGTLACLESSNTILTDWPESDVPTKLFTALPQHKDNQRSSIWPLLLFGAMQITLADPTYCQVLRDVTARLELSMLDLIRNPSERDAGWRKAVEEASVDVKKDAYAPEGCLIEETEYLLL